jgi:hypothetical protein
MGGLLLLNDDCVMLVVAIGDPTNGSCTLPIRNIIVALHQMRRVTILLTIIIRFECLKPNFN